MKNCVSINLKKNENVIKLNEDASQEEIMEALKKKLTELKKLYKEDLQKRDSNFRNKIP